MEKAEERSGQLIEDEELPAAGEHLWAWFWTLDGGRGYGLAGPLPLTYSDIAAWASLHGIEIQPSEVEIIKAMDAARIRATHKLLDKK